MAVFAAYLVLLCAAGFAQSLEVASVKPALPDSRVRGSMRGGPGTGDPGQITYTNVTLHNVLLRAYDIQTFQLTGPDWLQSRKYDISAKVPPGTTKAQFGPMLQKLLADRFHLVIHHETKDLQGFELVAGKSGAKLKPTAIAASQPAVELSAPPKTDPEGYPQFDGPGLIFMEGIRGKAVLVFVTAKAQGPSALTQLISREFRLPILDNTGLTGKFDFHLEFAPQPPGALPAPLSPDTLPSAPDDSGPNLTTAVQQQLGLRLNPRKVPVDMVVVDRAEQAPIEN
jgi:uncharacterized protein (TIGR03435 family)